MSQGSAAFIQWRMAIINVLILNYRQGNHHDKRLTGVAMQVT